MRSRSGGEGVAVLAALPPPPSIVGSDDSDERDSAADPPTMPTRLHSSMRECSDVVVDGENAKAAAHEQDRMSNVIFIVLSALAGWISKYGDFLHN